ncbi:MAG: hypothetical protein NZO16_00665 [Deltaproteobacteria bacterium]|nr:hypothetical protein [Deltaproteobacteria bacterium]
MKSSITGRENSGDGLTVKKILDNTKNINSKADGQLIHAWQDFQKKADFWRSMFLIQLPLSVFALVFASVIYINRNITLHVPKNPAPGFYSIVDVPDSEFINFSINFANLLFSYTPASIDRQYSAAKTFLAPVTQREFAEFFFKQEIPVVKTTGVSQIFIIDPARTKVNKYKNLFIFSLTGELIRILANRETRHTIATTEITLRTFPHNHLNPYGILVVDFKDLSDTSS